MIRNWLLLAIQTILLAAVCASPGPLHAATNSVTFTFTRVVELQCNEGFGEACPNDYYPKVDIDAQGLDDGKGRFCCAHDTDFQPNWVFTRNVDTTHVPFSIHVELWDQDDLSADDPISIQNPPGGGGRALDLQVNLGTCTWQGGGLQGALNTQSSSSGTGLDSAKIYFTITSSAPSCVDSDGDGLPDAWEKNGFDANGDGVIDVNLPAMGASPNRKDLFLQLDYMVAFGHSHIPIQAAIQQVVQAFANAPVPNPDGTTGIQLHVDVGSIYGVGVVTQVPGTGGVTGTYGDYGGGGNKIAEVANTIVDWDGATGRPGTNFFTLKNMNPNRNNIFRYGMFVHQTNNRAAVNDCTSGWSKGIPGVNFLVSLGGVNGAGNACWGADGTGNSVGTQTQQAGTLMHEFGHTLGLQHGGGDPVNNKPNYLSVMNYTMQACTVTAVPGAGVPGGCDYSRVLLPSLNENALDECQGSDTGALGLGPVDFNGNARLEGATNCQPPNSVNVQANVNKDTSADANNNGIQDPGEPPIFGTLTGFQDWGALAYNFRTVFDFTTAGDTSEQEPDPVTIDSARNALTQAMLPKLKLTVTGPATASPGDTVTYGIKLENPLADGARGPALNVAATDTKPDSSTQILNIGTVKLGAQINNSVTYTVPCSTADAATLSDGVHVQGADFMSNPIDLTSAVSTVIHTPVLVITKTATATVNAGEAIAYSIQYQNTGTGTALNVTIADLVPKDVYYSLVLDQGAGPKPASVILNGDGTRTLVWNIGSVAGGSAPSQIQFTARPTLLALGGTNFTNNVSLTYKKGAACGVETLTASANTVITVVPLKEDHEPQRYLHWKEHAHKEPAEMLARIQATDQRFDGRGGTPPDGALSQSEVKAAFARGNFWQYLFHRNRPIHLEHDLLALYFNLATRRINADSRLELEHDTPSGLTNARDAALSAQTTLSIPYSEATEAKYHSAIEVIEELNH